MRIRKTGYAGYRQENDFDETMEHNGKKTPKKLCFRAVRVPVRNSKGRERGFK
jgi:hypothetical protein